MFIYLLDIGEPNVQCPISNKERTSRRCGKGTYTPYCISPEAIFHNSMCLCAFLWYFLYITDSFPKTMYSTKGGLYQNCSKNCAILNFGFFFRFRFSLCLHGDIWSKSFKRHQHLKVHTRFTQQSLMPTERNRPSLGFVYACVCV